MTSRHRNPLLSILKWPFILINILMAFALILSYTAYHVAPSKASILAFFGLAYPYLLLGNLLFVVFWLLLRIKYALISLLAIFIGWNHTGRLIQLRFNPIPNGEGGITVVSYNVQNFVKANTSSTKYINDFSNKENIISLLSDLQPGIVCLQEALYDRQDVKGFPAKLGQQTGCPHYYYENYYETTKNKVDAIMTLSRYPIIDKGFLVHADKRFGIFTDIVIKTDTIRVYNLHLASIHFRQEDYRFFEDISSQPEQEKLIVGFVNIVSKMKSAYLKREIQVDLLLEHLERSPYPVVICADLNDTPSANAYNQLRGNKKDAFIISGSGIGKTYAGDLFPAFRIDYIFHESSIESANFMRHKIKLSDHYPVSCIILLAGSE